MNPNPPARDLPAIRRDIDRIDRELLDLLLRRMDCSKEVAAYKMAHGLPVLNAGREQEILDRIRKDAGGEYVYTKNDSDTSVAVDLEEAYLLASAADTWINVGPCNTLAELTAQNPKFADVPAVRNRQVFNNNRRQTPAGGSDFWESGVIRPDLVLHDLCAVFNPHAADTAELYYYKRLE